MRNDLTYGTMKTKNTPRNFTFDTFKGFLVVVIFMSFISTFGQTITNVSPTRITIGSKVTITGTNFDNTTRAYIRVSNNLFLVSRTLVSSEVMTFIIGDNGSSDILGGVVSVFAGESAITQPIDYIAPTSKVLGRNKSFFVKEIYTNWKRGINDFWSSNEWIANGRLAKDPEAPDNNHELLGYKMSNDSIYSTGVNDELLESRLSLTEGQILGTEPGYVKSVFKAYSTNGVQGKTSDLGKGTFIIAADRIDGVTGSAENASNFDVSTLNAIKGLKVFDVIIDGIHGLNLGIGVTNFNTNTEVKFFSGNGQPGVLGDKTPDLLITQMADTEGSDVYYYADPAGNIVGRPIKFSMTENTDTTLAVWKMDLFRFNHGEDFSIAVPQGRKYFTDTDLFKPIRMAAFDLEDFEITEEEQVEVINSMNMNAGGSADMAFLAYNQGAFNLKSPVAEPLLSKFVCRVIEEGGNTIIKFELIDTGSGINVGIDDDDGGIRVPDPTKLPSEELTYEWSRYNTVISGEIGPSLTIPGVNLDHLGTYKVKIGNGQGTIILPVDLLEGGTPYYWENGGWRNPYDELNPVEPMERGLVFNDDYNGLDLTSNVLEGCDCVVKPGADVTIPKGKTLKLYNKIVVEDELIILDEDDSPTGIIPAGTLTLENEAGLIQIKNPTPTNKNHGNILAKRYAFIENIYDYVYWSSPVIEGDLSMIPGATSHVYEWQVNTINANLTLGNWVKKTGAMEKGRGYIKRVNEITTVKTRFVGEPNNGPIDITVYKTETVPSGKPMTEGEKHLNLIGNPYPSAINADTFLHTNAGEENPNASLEGHVKVWTHGKSIFDTNNDSPFYENFKYNYGDQYATYNLLGTVPDSLAFEGFIASGQGFFVQVNEDALTDSPTVSFNNSMRYDAITGDAYDNTDFQRSSEPTGDAVQAEKQLIWLSLVNENNISSVTLVGYAEGATNGKDRLYDANSGAGAMRVYSVLDDSDFLIQGRALPFKDSDKVPLGIEILKNGIYKIGIDHLKGSLMLNEDQGIYLEDTYNNVIHNLKNTPYSFTATAGEIKDRFVLRYTNKTLSVDDKQVSDTFVYIKNQQLYIKASKNIESVLVYDLTGKKLMDYKLDGYTDRFNTQFQFSRGAYLTVIKLENTETITKKVMN